MQFTFKQVKKAYIKTLSQYVPVVARVHGGSHPEFFEVRKLFESIDAKIKEAGANMPNLDEDFAALRKVTDNYTVPQDVCESYEAVYKMLAELDVAYNNNI